MPFAAGGATDFLGRALASELGKRLKQNVIVENRAGAGGSVGAQAVALSPADGYTLLLASGSMFTVNQYIYGKLPYSLDNFSLVGKVASGPMVVTVNAGLPVKNIRELIAYAQARPGKLNFVRRRRQPDAHGGRGLQRRGGRQAGARALQGRRAGLFDLMAGVVEVAVANINAITPLLKGDRLRALAVTGRERSALLPDVPTVAEAGVPGFEYTGWFALMAPAGTPQPIVDRLLADLKTAVEQPGMKRYFEEQGMSAAVRPPGPLKEEIVQESARWQALVQKKQITAN